MKKYISMLLCAAVLTTAVTGCTSDEVSSSGNAPAAGGQVATDSTASSTTDVEPGSKPVVTTVAITSGTTVAVTTTAPEESNEISDDDTHDVPVANEPSESATVSQPYIPEEQEPDTPEIQPDEPENIPLTADDVRMELKHDGIITTDTENFTVEFTYIGDADHLYCFGCDYSLRKWVDDDWADVEFSDNAVWLMLGYLIGKESPKNSISVSLSDDFYAEPLTAGTYLLVKPLCDGVVLEETFEIKSTENDLVIADENGTMDLVIDKISEDRFSCSLPWPYPAVYEVMCDTAAYGDFCVGDTIEVQYAPMYMIEDYLYRLIPESIAMSDFELQPGADYKPVIYLYPEEKTEISVQLDYNGTLTVTEPQYGDGWNVTAYPDGRIISDGTEYPYLFWEGERAYELDMNEGFCVSGEDTECFLREKLSYLGLNAAETADFLEFWLPHMTDNTYNIIRFHSEDYTDNATLDISPAPDTLIRVYMTFEASDVSVDITPQQLEAAPERSGFTVVEWGGGLS